MNDDLDWTQHLGDAVVAQQTGVSNAIQAFRKKVYDADNMKSKTVGRAAAVDRVRMVILLTAVAALDVMPAIVMAQSTAPPAVLQPAAAAAVASFRAYDPTASWTPAEPAAKPAHR